MVRECFVYEKLDSILFVNTSITKEIHINMLADSLCQDLGGRQSLIVGVPAAVTRKTLLIGSEGAWTQA